MYVCMPAPPIARSFDANLRPINGSCGLAHLSCVRELKGSESGLQVGSVGLEVVQSASNAGLELRGILARRAVSRNLVAGHLDFLTWTSLAMKLWS